MMDKQITCDKCRKPVDREQYNSYCDNYAVECHGEVEYIAAEAIIIGIRPFKSVSPEKNNSKENNKVINYPQWTYTYDN